LRLSVIFLHIDYRRSVLLLGSDDPRFILYTRNDYRVSVVLIVFPEPSFHASLVFVDFAISLPVPFVGHRSFGCHFDWSWYLPFIVSWRFIVLDRFSRFQFVPSIVSDLVHHVDHVISLLLSSYVFPICRPFMSYVCGWVRCLCPFCFFHLKRGTSALLSHFCFTASSADRVHQLAMVSSSPFPILSF